MIGESGEQSIDESAKSDSRRPIVAPRQRAFPENNTLLYQQFGHSAKHLALAEGEPARTMPVPPL